MSILFLVLVLFGVDSAIAKKSSCEESYIPPHDLDLLIEISHWGMGRSVASYAEKAGYVFDIETYKEDCPDWAVFNFGRATGTTCLDMDVTTGYVSTAWVLQNLFHKHNSNGVFDQESFSADFFIKAQEWNMDHYLSEADTGNEHNMAVAL